MVLTNCFFYFHIFFFTFEKKLNFLLGPLNLSILEGINYKNCLVMDAISALCPLLREAHFLNFNISSSSIDFLSAHQLRSRLLSPNSCWSKVFIQTLHRFL